MAVHSRSQRSTGVALDPDHEALLRVALLPRDETRNVWRDVEPRLSQALFDDPRAVKIMPLVARALVSADIDAATRDRMKGIARHNFAGNRMLLADAGRALTALADRGVAGMTLEGAPLVTGYYDDASLRSVVSLDLLVAPTSVASAVSGLTAAGWRCTPPDRHLLRRKAGMWCHAPDHRVPVVLRWRLVPWLDRRGSGQDPELWQRAQHLEVSGQSTLAPCPEDLLLHIVLLAFERGWHHVPEWVMDAAMVLRRTPEFDWDYFARRVVEGHVTAPLADAMAYAERLVGLAVPEDVLRMLAGAPRSRSEHRRYERASRPISGRRQAVLGQFDDLWTRWSRSHGNLTTSARLRAMVPFLLGATNVDHLAAVPLVVAHRRVAAARRRADHVPNGHYART